MVLRLKTICQPNETGWHKQSIRVCFFMLSLFLASVGRSTAQTPLLAAAHPGQTPPKTWIDADTGHRVTRLSDEPNSQGLYFTEKAYTPDGLEMIYVSPK